MKEIITFQEAALLHCANVHDTGLSDHGARGRGDYDLLSENWNRQ